MCKGRVCNSSSHIQISQCLCYSSFDSVTVKQCSAMYLTYLIYSFVRDLFFSCFGMNCISVFFVVDEIKN